jgi:hypothetical protein
MKFHQLLSFMKNNWKQNLFCLLILAIPSSTVLAADLPKLIISDLDSSQFPTITFYLQPYDQDGEPIDELDDSSLRILEDQNTLPALQVEQLEPGIHWIAAVNAGPRLKDLAGGIYRFERIRSHLLNWIQNQDPDSPNDYSLTTNTGVLTSANANPIAWSEVLRGYQPNFELSQPNLVSLSMAIDLASSAQGSIPRKYAILYITPLMPPELRDQLPGIAERAKQMGVQVDVWLVGAGTLENSPSATPFRQLAEITGGSYSLFSGVGDLPDPSDSIEKLRWLYQVQYNSHIKSSGVHNLGLSLLQNGTWKDSNTLTFQLDVLPPNPIFFSPPFSITRAPVLSENRKQEDDLEPDQIEIQLLVEFPDQYKRSLIYSRLFANDLLVGRNTEEPFDRFIWDLTSYTESQTVLLKVDIQDEAGFSVSTVQHPVQIIVETRKRTFFELIIEYQAWIISAAILLTLFLMASAFITFRGQGKYLFAGLSRSKKSMDPVTQEITIKQIRPLFSPKIQQKPDTPVRLAAPEAVRENAVLIRLDDWLEEIPKEKLILPNQEETILGKDLKRVHLHLNDTAVSPIHARIRYQAPENYTIYDEGSISGTWLNYAPISGLGASLHHGDIVQFGRLTYRFKIAHPQSKPGLSILPYTIENE